MKVLVTGSRGYLGGHVVRELNERGHSVIGWDADWYTDRRSGEACKLELMPIPNVHAVVHLAWLSSAGNTLSDLQLYCERITGGLVARCRDAGITRFIFPSTVSVYGGLADCRDVIEEPMAGCAYSDAKVHSEMAVRRYMPDHLILRMGSLMGIGVTRTKTDVCVNSMASDAVLNGRIDLWHPQSIKPVLHVRDAARLISDAVTNPAICGTLNACSTCIKAIDIAAIAAEEAGNNASIKLIDADGANARSYEIRCDNLGAVWPLKCLRSVREAIQEFHGFIPSRFDKNIPWLNDVKRMRSIVDNSLVPRF